MYSIMQESQRRGRRKKRRKNGNWGRVAILIVLMVVLAGLVYVFVYGVPWKGSVGGAGEPGGSGGHAGGSGGQGGTGGTGGQGGSGSHGGANGKNGEDGADSQGSPGGEAPDPDEPTGIAALWYYNPDNADRYDAFAGLRPELDIEDVVWMVEVDLDKPTYTDVREVPDPDSLTLLVNKHFYLPRDYVPSDLVPIANTMLRKEAADSMRELIAAAAEEGHNLWVQSGVRSYDIQVRLFDQYSARDGVEVAETHSARPGHSEHQTGLTADLNTITDAFGDTPEGKWAAENCWKYGFIVRYTKENTDITQYKPEPWHLRFIGREAAAQVHDLGFPPFEEYWVKYVKNTPPSLG